MAAMSDEILRCHEQLLYPVVRVFAGKSAGSGTVLYSEEDPDNEGDHLTFILTNHHVISDLITTKKEFDSVLKRQVDKESLEHAHVEVFSYINMSEVDSTNRYRAEVVAYDESHDLAILRVLSPRKFDYVADLIDRDKIDDLRLFMDIAASGCSMAHEPFVSFGQLTFLNEIIDQRRYYMVNAGTYFGNSGGALFLKDTGEFIGVPSRLTGIQLGFGIDMVTFMGFGASADRIYEFFDEQELRFIYDPEDTYAAALERREAAQRQAVLELKAEALQQAED
jgi:S1-C subfamily serine protease